jgi:3-deoxy-7-phosphoheptulonate synthase
MSLPYTEALSKLDNGRVKSTRPLVPPQILEEDLPLYVSYLPFLRCIHWNL